MTQELYWAIIAFVLALVGLVTFLCSKRQDPGASIGLCCFTAAGFILVMLVAWCGINIPSVWSSK